MNIVMIGPVYPYKTGFSYYVALLYKQLAKRNSVTLLSYTMQYPKILFKKEQKDYTDDTLKIDEVEYVLNSANPVSCLRVAGRINKIKPDIVIFQWFHPYFAPCYYLISKALKNTKVLFMCHNVFPHERFPLDKILTKIVLKTGDFFIVHAESDAENLRSIIPNANIKTTVHPAYNFFKQQNITKSEARRALGLEDDENVILFFGLVREYKGLKHLLKALNFIRKADCENRNKIRLLVAGDFVEGRNAYEEMIKELRIADMVNIYDGHIPIPEVEKFFSASDMVVLPYESATQSGVIQVAYSFEKPVLATRVGGLPDVVYDGKTGYLVDPFRPDMIADAICDFFENGRTKAFEEGIREEKYKYSWERMEDNIYALFEDRGN